MAKRKKRNAVTLVSLLLTLLVLIGIYVWYTNKDKGTEDSKADSSSDTLTLATLDTEQLQTLHYIHEDADLTLVLEDGTWKYQEDKERPIDQSRVKNMIRVIEEIKALRVINENPENLSDYGLSEPVSYIRATQKDGVTVTLQIGDKAGDSGYYALVNEDKKVYLVANSYGSGLQYNDAALTAKEDLPSYTSNDIYHISISKPEGTDFELLYDIDNKMNKPAASLAPWVILKPYEEGYSADTAKVSELLTNYVGFSLNACVDYKGNNLAEYGLDNPKATIQVGYYEEDETSASAEDSTDTDNGKETSKKQSTITLYVGDSKDEKESYVKTDRSNAVYTMNTDSINEMLDIDAFSYIYSFVAIPNIDTVDRIDVTIENKPYTMEIKRTTVKNDEGEEETKETFYYNGNEVDEELFRKVYQVVISAKYDAEIKNPDNINPEDAFLTIRYQLNNENRDIVTTSYLPYDESFYVVDTGYAYRFFADRRKIDYIAKTVSEFKVSEE